MKFIAIVLFALVGLAAAQGESDARPLAEAIQKRAEALLDSSKKALDSLRQGNKFFLAGALEHQTSLVEALVLDLKTQLAQKDIVLHTHHIHVIEEELLHLENQISDELRILQETQQNSQPRNENADQLVKRGQDLVARAKLELEHHRNLREARSIEHEIQSVEALIKAIQAKPTGAELANDEQQLARHERTLYELIERANVRNPRGPRGPGGV